METLVIVAEHRNKCYTRTRTKSLLTYNSTPPKNFREINCRTPDASEGILPTPKRASCVPVIKQSPVLKAHSYRPNPIEAAHSKSTQKSTPIPIKDKAVCDEESFGDGFFYKSLSFPEGWAGPTYSSSPPPSSLPIPNFLQPPRRTLSLDLPHAVSNSTTMRHPFAKSAPASPTREFSPRATMNLFFSVGSATKALRQILNLDLDGE